MKVKPAKGARVRDPYTLEVLPANGRRVPETSYWRRRLRDGDVRLVSPVKDEAPGAVSAGSVSEPEPAADGVTFTSKKMKKRSNNSMNGGKQ